MVTLNLSADVKVDEEKSSGVPRVSADVGTQRAFENLYKVASERLGEKAAKELQRYFFVSNLVSGRETHQGQSGDCWINAAENWMLVNDKSGLAVCFQKLIEDGWMASEDFTQPDAADPVLGARHGASLAFDRAINKKFGTTYGANDFQIESFESFIRQSSTRMIYNGEGANSGNTANELREFLSNSNDAKGVRCSIEWLEGSKHVFHQVVINQSKDGRVYFYHSLSDPNIKGPNRRQEGIYGVESMPLEDFISHVRVAFVPSRVADKHKMGRSIDPAYFAPQDSSRVIPEMLNRSYSEDPLLMGVLSGHYPKKRSNENPAKTEAQSRRTEKRFQLLGTMSLGFAEKD